MRHTSDAQFLTMSRTGSCLPVVPESWISRSHSERREPMACIRVNVIAIRCNR